MLETEIIRGTIENIIYKNSENGYVVCEIFLEEGIVTATGGMPEVAVGQLIEAYGGWIMHKTYGRQFAVSSYEVSLPDTENAIYRYLSAGTIKGIGPKTAKKIVEKFGGETLDVLMYSPARLSKIPGITLKKAEQISEEYNRILGMSSTVEFFKKLDIPALYAVRAYKYYGNLTTERVKKDPFCLCNYDIGIDFREADRVSALLKIERDSEVRTFAGIKYILNVNLGNGHTFIPKIKLGETAASLLSVSSEKVFDCIDSLCSDGELIPFQVGSLDGIFLSHVFEAEMGIADKLDTLLGIPTGISDEQAKSAVDSAMKKMGVEFSNLQRAAIHKALTRRVLILTGGPGTGKSTAVSGMIAAFENMGLSVVLCAPTGRAAKRLSSICGIEAYTVHRLLEMGSADEYNITFGKNFDNPIKEDVIIVDEMSMTDIFIMDALLDAVKPTSRIIMVGDSDQLPSVGPGNVLKDMAASGKIESVVLNEIFRQAKESAIVINAHRINSGEYPVFDKEDTDFFFVECKEPEKVCDIVVKLCCERIPQKYGFDISNIQIIAPSRKTVTGTVNLNRTLQEKINPYEKQKTQITYKDTVFRIGDKVMQNKNNYDITYKSPQGEGMGIFNGDIGSIEQIDVFKEEMLVRYDDRVAKYSAEFMEQLELAYAVTVHKSQGSEYDAVIMPVLLGAKSLFNRNLFYTSVTRAKKLMLLVGDSKVVKQMVDNNTQNKRYSGLKYFML